MFFGDSGGDFDFNDPLDWEDRSESMPFWRHACAGSVAGIAEHVGMYPLDTVKTRMQANVHPGSIGVMQTMRGIVSEQGVPGLFRGVGVIGAGCVPAHCGLFITYELGKDTILKDGDGQHQPWRAASCGAVASTVHDVILTPTDVVKQRLQLGCYKGPIDCLKLMLQTEGIGALFRSLPVTLASNAPNLAVLAAVKESMQLALNLNRYSSSVDLPWYFLCGGVGGGVAAAVTLPLDVVKTRIQTHGALTLSSDPDLRRPKRQGVVDVVRSILRKEGVRGFYKGLVPRVLVATPAAAICWGTYESVQSFLCHTFDDDAQAGEVVPALVGKALDVGNSAASNAGLGAASEAGPLEWEVWDPLSVPLWKHCVAGSAAGIMEHVAMYPVDTVKTQMQAVPAVPGTPAMTVRQTIHSIRAEQGVYGFFRGCTAIGAACIPAHIGLFGTYELSKMWLLKGGAEKEHAPLRAACCGAISTVVHDSIIVPMDVVKQRLQLGCYSNMWDCIRRTSRSEGFGAFYRSLPSTLVMECPFYAALVASNESLKIALGMEGAGRVQERSNSTMWHFISAGLSGIFASAATQPLDVIKTRLQTQEVRRDMAREGGDSTSVRYYGLVSTMRSVLAEEGIRGLYRGTVPRMVFAAPAAAMCWGTYEAAKQMLTFM